MLSCVERCCLLAPPSASDMCYACDVTGQRTGALFVVAVVGVVVVVDVLVVVLCCSSSVVVMVVVLLL